MKNILVILGGGRQNGNTKQLAADFFWTYEQAVSYYKFAVINYIGFNDKGMLLAGGCGDTNGKPQINQTKHLEEAYAFGKNIYKG